MSTSSRRLRNDEVLIFNPRKIFVGDLPEGTTQEQFRKYWEKWGKLESCNLMKGFGFVVFRAKSVASKVLSRRNALSMNGRKLKIKKARPTQRAALPPVHIKTFSGLPDKSVNAYGQIYINSTSATTHFWKFKVMNMNNRFHGLIALGIVEITQKAMNDSPFTMNGKGYALRADGRRYAVYSRDYGYCLDTIKDTFGVGDVVEMTLNLRMRKLYFCINGKQCTFINNIKVSQNIAYKMAVCLHRKFDVIQLMDYYQIKPPMNQQRQRPTNKCRSTPHHDRNNDVFGAMTVNELERKLHVDPGNQMNQQRPPPPPPSSTWHEVKDDILQQKDDKIDALQIENKVLVKAQKETQMEKKYAVDQYEQKLQEKDGKIEKLEKELKSLKKNLESMKVCSQRKSTAINKQRQKLKRNEDILKQKDVKINKLQIENASLMEEQKELEIENKRLKQEIKKLQVQTMDVTKYETWNWEQIMQWILGLEESRFMKYESSLNKALSEEEPNGEDLLSVDVTDIKRWGVTKFGDIKALNKCIKQLINNNIDHSACIASPNEGNITAEIYIK